MKEEREPRFRRKSQKKKTRTELGIPKSKSPKDIKFKSKSENLFGDFATEIETKSLETIIEEYKKNPFFKTKINIILNQFQKNLQENNLTEQEFIEQILIDTKSEGSSFNKGSPIKYQTLKNKVGKNNYAYAVRLMEIKQKIKELKQ